MSSIRKNLLQFVFTGAFMKRWNDKLRPTEFLEVDKQAHKMLAAWVLYELNAASLTQEERVHLGVKIIEGGLFDYFYRLIITDIKPPVFYQIKNNPEHYRRLSDWVLQQLAPRVQPLGEAFQERLTAWVRNNGEGHPDLAACILDAAHLYASHWEFCLLKNINPLDDELQEIDTSFKNGLASHSNLIGMPELIEGVDSVLGRFVHLCGQLRFQIRWSQTPRIPETSVLGHMFIVACYSYFVSLALEACSVRLANNFFAGLVHDLPELLTRDIISPVKRSVAYLSDLIKEYEKKELERRVFNPLTMGGYSGLVSRLAYFLGIEVGNEFAETIIEDNCVRHINFSELCTNYNENRFNPKDGETLKICDVLAAFVEVYTALRNGISSDQLQQALWLMRRKYQQVSLGQAVHVGALLADFD
ncbi:HD domain-containing protein [Desulfovibrionales bacterium]